MLSENPEVRPERARRADHSGRWVIVLGLAAAFFPACEGDYEKRVVQAKSPLRRVEFFADQATFFLEPDARIDELVRMEMFQGFRPEMTIDEAIREVGHPSWSGRNNFGPFYVYRRAAGSVILSLERHDSGVFRGTPGWYLRAHPTAWTFREAFAAPIQQHLAGVLGGRREVAVMHPNGFAPAIWVILEGEKVKHMKWCKTLATWPGLGMLKADVAQPKGTGG